MDAYRLVEIRTSPGFFKNRGEDPIAVRMVHRMARSLSSEFHPTFLDASEIEHETEKGEL